MKVLPDNNVNRRFALLIHGHEIKHVQDLGWQNLQNGMLLNEAEQAGYSVLITADKQMRHQQNMSGRTISVVVLAGPQITLRGIAPLAPNVQSALDSGLPPGSFHVVLPDS